MSKKILVCDDEPHIRMLLEQTLEDLDLDDRTMIIFTSDNGGLDNGGRPTDNAPLRSGKGYAYESGVHVPLVVCIPS